MATATAEEALSAMLAVFCSKRKKTEKIKVKIRCGGPLPRRYLSAGECRVLLLAGSKAHILDVGQGVKLDRKNAPQNTDMLVLKNRGLGATWTQRSTMRVYVERRWAATQLSNPIPDCWL